MKKHYLTPLLVETRLLQLEVFCGVSAGEDYNPTPGGFDDDSD